MLHLSVRGVPLTEDPRSEKSFRIPVEPYHLGNPFALAGVHLPEWTWQDESMTMLHYVSDLPK